MSLQSFTSIYYAIYLPLSLRNDNGRGVDLRTGLGVVTTSVAVGVDVAGAGEASTMRETTVSTKVFFFF